MGNAHNLSSKIKNEMYFSMYVDEIQSHYVILYIIIYNKGYVCT
jgi:hypothetical protein